MGPAYALILPSGGSRLDAQFHRTYPVAASSGGTRFGAAAMDTIMLVGGPRDGQIETLKDYYEVHGKPTKREGWPLIVEVRAYIGERPVDTAAPGGEEPQAGRRLARYRLTERVTAEGHQVYEYVPD